MLPYLAFPPHLPRAACLPLEGILVPLLPETTSSCYFPTATAAPVSTASQLKTPRCYLSFLIHAY